jgi:hypothetical protein
VPVAINGTLDILRPGSMRMSPDRAVTVEFGAPIPVEDRNITVLLAEVEAFLAARVTVAR